MELKDDAWDCSNRLSDLAKSEHGRWMGRGVYDPAAVERIKVMRDAARLLKACAMELASQKMQDS